jgi:prevent-host-death family protein
MTSINLNEAKAHLGKYVARAAAGEPIVICERNRPVAELRPVLRHDIGRPLQIGILKGVFEIPPDFDASIESFEDDFYASRLES